ncbi:energy transducer TonB [Steroidobacter sp. S1-65]|uniref:Energy transducer TonB n=1 Tax=Steroidobacter gossypii TaxID=2805490 RepID=A0ABS1WRP5_9GAMM|nr:energy transducer TonB [Steroidobacter gossypii]MBM0103647.1 energy transducer TonB [Steroidobacter gossypii]
MATDTARVELELASGRNEITAPFHETAQRRRRQHELSAASVGAPAVAPSRLSARPPWIAFAAALVAVALAVWWVMAQRMPDIDPGEVIARNLHDAQTAMADGRYTDPSERSAFHYYSTVLALDPTNAEAIAGIDAIANRHLTDARVLLAEQKIAEAGVALEKARRVRPDHNGLTLLEAQWRTELRKLLAASTGVAKTISEPIVKPAGTRQRATAPKRTEQTLAAANKVEEPQARKSGSGPEMKAFVERPQVAKLDVAAAALAAAKPPSTRLEEMALPVSEPDVSIANTGANIVQEIAPAASPAPTPAPAVPPAEPKLIKMIQPRYPQEALMRGLEGWVDISLQVSPTGDVIDPRIEGSSRGRMFNRAALNAVQQWKYEPRSDGASSGRVRVRVQFKQAD